MTEQQIEEWLNSPLEPLPELPTIGVCASCNCEAKVKTGERNLCFPCAYSEANW